MLRGFLSGIIWGSVFSVAVVAVVSILESNAGRVMPNKASEVVVPAGSSFNRDAPEGAATIPSTDQDVTATAAPSVSAPTLEAPASPSTDTAPAAQPQTGNLPQAPAATPPAPDAPGAVALGAEEPVLPNPQALVPEAPSADVAPSAPAAAAPPAPAPAQPKGDTTAPQAPPEPPKLAEGSVATSPAPTLPAAPAAPDSSAGADTIAPSGVTTDRLPRIGDLSQEVAEAPVQSIPAIDAFAAPYSNPEGKPEMGILLLDVTPRPSLTQLAEFPFAATFAVDPEAPDAAEAMKLYRQAGFEVAMAVNLPAEMTPQDAEVSFEVYKRRLPEAVAVLDTQDSGFQVNRPLIGAMMAILKDRGLGLVTYPRGLNTALQIAERQDIPAKLVFRTFDGNGENSAVMRRFLDQAAFRAGQEAGVLVVGHARPETLQTLVEWGVQGRATTIELAPLSVILKAPN